MTPIRFRIRTIMITIAVLAVLMGLFRLFPTDFPLFFAQIAPFAIYSWILEKRKRRFSEGRSANREDEPEMRRGAPESVGQRCDQKPSTAVTMTTIRCESKSQSNQLTSSRTIGTP